MALNFSHRPIFLNGDSECHGSGFCNLLRSEGDVKDCFDYGRDRSKSGGCSQESISNDILDLLPSDPFGMEISTTFTAITGWLEDLEMDYGGYASEVVANNAEDNRLFAGLNILWNNAMVFQAFPGSYGFDCNTHIPSEACEFYGTKAAPVGGSTCSGFRLERGTYGCLDSNGKGSTLAHLGFGPSSRLGEFSEMKSTGDFSCHDRYGSANSYVASPIEREISLMFDSSSDCGQHSLVQETGSAASFDGFMSVEGFDGCIKKIQDGCLCTGDSFEAACKINDSWTSGGRSTGNSRSEIVISEGRSSDGNGLPHMALTFVLSYLAIQDLLSVERVCKFLRTTVQTDALLWRSIQIGQPLNEKITDDVLVQLSARAQGNLKCLSLVECPRITDEGLKLVVQSNPRLTKLSVPGCTRVSINGILDILKTLKSSGNMRVKHLRVGGLYGMNMEQFEDLKTLLGLDNITRRHNTNYMPHFFQREKYLSFEDDDRNIDIEVCPRCVNLRLVYDCPTDACRGKIGVQSCRACTICIPRCYQCGRCINDGEYEENFCLELLCLDCSLQHHRKCDQIMLDDTDVETSG